MFVIYYKKSIFGHSELKINQNIIKVEYNDWYKDLEFRPVETSTKIDLVTAKNTHFNKNVGKLRDTSCPINEREKLQNESSLESEYASIPFVCKEPKLISRWVSPKNKTLVNLFLVASPLKSWISKAKSQILGKRKRVAFKD